MIRLSGFRPFYILTSYFFRNHNNKSKHTNIEMRKYPILLGFTGSFGSGCTETIQIIKEHYNEKVIDFSLSKELTEIIKKTKWEESIAKASPEEKRHLKQQAGNHIRKTYGREKLASQVFDKIKANEAQLDGKEFILVDSIRNIGEIDFFRNNFLTYIWAIYANENVRAERMLPLYGYKLNLFKEDDERDHLEGNAYGQQVDTCVDDADILIKNERSIKESVNQRNIYFEESIKPHLELISDPKSRVPDMREIYMTMAYAAASQSRCLQRKVGALITTEDFEVVSVGHNDVPKNLESCIERDGGCARDIQKTNLINTFIYCPKCGVALNEDKICNNCGLSVDKEYFKSKNLGACRALHAEESAIVEAAKSGIRLKNGIIFTTTFPCNMCANKIANVGVKKVIYVEPYPEVEAIKILKKNNVEIELFEGIKSRAFFSLFKRIEEINRLCKRNGGM